MKKNSYKTLFLFLLFSLLILNLFAQSNLQLHVEVSGKGKQAVILLPGFGCSGKVWDETVQNLSGRFSCHVVTFPGFAGEPAQADVGFRQWEAAVAGYIGNNHLEKPVIIGHSIGGAMAMSIAADYPALAGKIVVVDALPYLAGIFNPAAKANEHPDCEPMVKQFTGMTEAQLYGMQKQMIPAMLADTSKQATVIQWVMHSDRNTMGRIYCQFSNTDLREKIAKVQCPSLILLEAPFKANDDVMQQQYARLGNKTIAYSTKGLHFIMYDDKDWFFQQLTTFLQ